MKILIFVLLMVIPAFSLGFVASIALRKYKERLEEKTLEKLREEKINNLPTVRLADELFEREEAWDVIADRALKENSRK